HDGRCGVVELSLLAGIEVLTGVEGSADAGHGDLNVDVAGVQDLVFTFQIGTGGNHAVIEIRAGNLQYPDGAVVGNGVFNFTFPKFQVERSRGAGFERLSGLEYLFPLLGQRVTRANQIVEYGAAAKFLQYFNANRVRGWNCIH